MLITRNQFWQGVLAAAVLAMAAVEARAGLFDFLRPKSTKKSGSVARGQSPDPRYAPFPTPNGWQPPAGGGPAPFPQADPYAGSGWGYESSPCYNCGEMDKHQGWLQFWRKKTHQTYYPRSAPYCQPEWGWHQSCWRRMRENYNCQRPDYHASTPQPRMPMPPPVPVAPPGAAPQGPQSRAYPSGRTVGYGRSDFGPPQRGTGVASSNYSNYGNAGSVARQEPEPGEWTEAEDTSSGPQFDSSPQDAERPAYYSAPAPRR